MKEKFAPARRIIGKVTAIGMGLGLTVAMTAGPAHAAVARAGTYTTTSLLDPVTEPVEETTDPVCGLLGLPDCDQPSDPNLDSSTDSTTDPLDPVLDPADPSGDPSESPPESIDTILRVSTIGNLATFAFAADPATEGAMYLCSLAGPSSAHPLQACESPLQYTGLEPGDYVFSVTALAGSVEDLEPATHAWTVTDQTQSDSEAPQTRVAGKPRNHGWLLRRGTVVRVSANEAATFRCTLDGKMVDPCGDTVRLTRLASSTHVFRATAVDEAGNADQSPARKVFTVPRNNKALKHSAAWKKRNARGYFLNSFSVTKKKGAVLRTRARGIKKLALVASTGRGHGTVEVFLGKKRLKTVSLHTKRAQKKRVVPVASFRGKKRGLIRIRVVSAGKPVRIQGVGIARR
jgi:hypothetical protein